MNASQRIRLLITLGAAAFGAAMLFGSAPAFARGQANAPKGSLFAQKLVESTQAKHPEADEVGISTMTKRGCVGIASTDKSDIGEKCEKGDVEPMHTGKPFVEKEKDGFDVSLPLHDSTGKLIGTVGIELKPVAGQTEASATQLAQKIATEMEAQIHAKAELFKQSE